MNFTDNKEQDGKQMSGMHSSKQYDQDLEWIRSKVLLMGGLVGAAAVMATVPGTKTFMKRSMRKGKRALENAVCNMW